MLSKSVFGSLEPDKIELCFQIYFQTWIRCHTSMTPLFLKPEVIKNELYRKFLSVQPEIVNKCVDNSLAIVYSYEPELKQIVDMMNLFESGYSCAGVPLFRRNGNRQSSGRKPLFRNKDTAFNGLLLPSLLA